MRCNKRKIWWLAFLLLLVPVPSSALHFDFDDDGLFPQPYVYKDREIANTKPRFTLNQSGALPDWLSLAVQHRTRYETLNSQFRSGTTGSDQALSLRTLAQATVRLHPGFKIQMELQDSRAELADSGTVISGLVNAAELLEANLQWLAKGLFQEDSRSLLRGGRLTMDFGKRRLVSRNRFRNVLNAFTGVDWIWKSQSGNTVRALLTLPVNRLPSSQAELLENDASFDEETLDRIFWGVFFASPSLPWGGKGEFYLFGLHEDDDGPDFLTRNRQLYTPGFRLYRPPQQNRIDYEWESIFQFGTSRTSTATTDTRDLDHFAHFHHAEVGYTFSIPWSPRLILAYDYASGDSDPNDGSQGRFDPLFGATVFDFSPTGIHTPFVRSNITGPGVIISIHPHRLVSTYIHYRAFWLASDTDVWAGNSGLRDPTGGSGSFLGQQWFVRAKWRVLANMQLEGGIAYRIDGDFQKTAPNTPGEGNTLYSYIQTTFSF